MSILGPNHHFDHLKYSKISFNAQECRIFCHCAYSFLIFKPVGRGLAASAVNLTAAGWASPAFGALKSEEAQEKMCFMEFTILLWKDPPFLMGKSTISIAIFNSKLWVYQRVTWNCLVLWNMTFTFPYIGNKHPNWRTPWFFRGVGSTTKQWNDAIHNIQHGFSSPFWIMKSTILIGVKSLKYRARPQKG